MNQRQLAFFATLAEELHFVRAAERLHVTQSALSQQIARLEQIVGVRLFERTRRHVELTEAGRSFLEEVRPLLRGMDLAVTMARRAAEGHSGRLTIGFADAAALNVLPALVSAYSSRYPGVKLVLHEMVSHQQVEALHAGRLDVALLRPVFKGSELASLPLLREPYVVAMANGHRLAAEERIRFAALRDEVFITTSRTKARYVDGRFRGVFHRAGFPQIVGQEVNELHAILGLVAGGLGIALVPSSVTNLMLPNLVYRPLHPNDSPVAELVLAWSAGQNTSTSRRFIELARRSIARKDHDAGGTASRPAHG